jgi:ferredoxin
MTTCTVTFEPYGTEVEVPRGTLICDAASKAGLDLNMPCGGQGRCGRCAVIVEAGDFERRSAARLSPEAMEEGYVLACQTVVQGDLVISIPPQERIERRLPTAQRVAKVELPFAYDPEKDQTIRKYFLEIEPPSLIDKTDDLARVVRTLNAQHGTGIERLSVDVALLRKMAGVLRGAQWRVTAVLETDTWVSPGGPPRLVDVTPGDTTASSWGVAVDIGTTSNVVYLVDLLTGKVVDTAVLEQTVSSFNECAAKGEDADFGRPADKLQALDTPPFYAIELYPGSVNTWGGPRRDAAGRIIDLSGNPIPRLYGAGELGSIWASLYQGQETSGNAWPLVASQGGAQPRRSPGSNRAKRSVLSGASVDNKGEPEYLGSVSYVLVSRGTDVAEESQYVCLSARSVEAPLKDVTASPLRQEEPHIQRQFGASGSAYAVGRSRPQI